MRPRRGSVCYCLLLNQQRINEAADSRHREARASSFVMVKGFETTLLDTRRTTRRKLTISISVTNNASQNVEGNH
jgi:hypothetical protein